MNIPMEGKVLLDFYADWCGPCRAMNPILDKFQNTSGVELVKVNVEDGIAKNTAVGIQSIQQLNELCA